MTLPPKTLPMPGKPMANEPMPSRDAAESAAAAWIARRDTAEWNGAAFEQWLAESVSHRVAYYRLNAAWQEAGRLRVLKSATDPFEGSQSLSISGVASAPCRVPADLEDQDNVGSPPVVAQGSRHQGLHAVAAGFALVLVGAMAVWKAQRPEPGRFSTVIGLTSRPYPG